MRLSSINRMLLLPAIAMAAVVACVTTSCSDGSCNSNTSSIPMAKFYSSSTGSAIVVDSLTVYGVGAPGDTAIMTCGRSVSSVSLPLRTTTGTTKFVIHYDQKLISDTRLNDTITLNYEALPYFESSECGAMFVFDMKECSSTNHIVDSVKVLTPRVTNLEVENIRIYMRTE